MKKCIVLILLLLSIFASAATYTGTNAAQTRTPLVSTDMIFLGAATGTTPYKTTFGAISAYILNNPTITGGITMPQSVDPMYIEMYEGSGGGTNKITLTVPATIAADHIYTFGTTGILLDGSSISGTSYTLPTATTNTLGGVKVDGSTITIAGGVISSASASAGYVSVPTYSDQTCTAGQYATDASYYYLCKSTNVWDRVLLSTWLAAWSNPTPVTPTLSSATIASNGTSLTLVMSLSTSVGAGGSGGVDVDCTTAGQNIAATYASGAPGTSLVYTLASTVNSSDTCNVDYTQPTNGLEGTTGGSDVATIASASITNNSTQTSGGSYQIAYGEIYTTGYAGYSASQFKITVYSSTGTLLATSNTGTQGSTPGWVQVTFPAGTTLTAGAGVYLGVHFNADMELYTATGGYWNRYGAGSTWPTPMASIATVPFHYAGNINLGAVGLRITNSSSQLLAGETTITTSLYSTLGVHGNNEVNDMLYTVPTL